MSCPSEWELWACAHHVLREHGDGVEGFITERIAAMARAQDLDGIATWQSIARKVMALQDRSSVQ